MSRLKPGMHPHKRAWVDKQGNMHKLESMTDSHLRNVIKMLRDYCHEYAKNSIYYEVYFYEDTPIDEILETEFPGYRMLLEEIEKRNTKEGQTK